MVTLPAVEVETTQTSSQYRGHNIVFIVGSPRSGTTWLQRLLATHPKLHTGQESCVFDYVYPQLRRWHRHLDSRVNTGRGGIGLPCYFSEEEFMKRLNGYMVALLQPMIGNLVPGELFIEKTPSHALCLAEILEMLPDTRVIHLLRDARDVSASLMAASRTWGTRWAPGSATKAAWMWKNHVRAVRQAVPAIPAGQFLEVRYEDLHASTSDTLRQVLDFLSLEWDEDDLRSAIAANSADRTRAGGGTGIPVGGEFRTDSGLVIEPPEFTRKARPNAWKEDLSLFDRLQVWRIARKLMAEVGYPWKLPL